MLLSIALTIAYALPGLAVAVAGSANSLVDAAKFEESINARARNSTLSRRDSIDPDHAYCSEMTTGISRSVADCDGACYDMSLDDNMYIIGPGDEKIFDHDYCHLAFVNEDCSRNLYIVPSNYQDQCSLFVGQCIQEENQDGIAEYSSEDDPPIYYQMFLYGDEVPPPFDPGEPPPGYPPPPAYPSPPACFIPDKKT